MSALVIQSPRHRTVEREYAISTIFGDWLGIDHIVHSEDRINTRITLGVDSSDASALLLPDTFLQAADLHWHDPATLPKLPLSTFDTHRLAVAPRVTSRHLPILFGDDEADGSSNGIEVHGLPIDILGSTFFMLSRYEEVVVGERDTHDRFPATASVAYKAGFLERPILDEYVEVLWAAIHRIWPSLRRKEREGRVMVSCDVDHPFLIHGGPGRVLRRLGGDLLVRRSLMKAVKTALAWPLATMGHSAFDEFRQNIEWMMSINETQGNPVAFYFIPERTDAWRDRSPSLDEPRVRKLLRAIHERGHEIGFHPGYCTYRDPDTFRRSFATLRRVLEEEGIEQSRIGGRQHYLRWSTPMTARLWNEQGLDYDSTLSFADHAGFRCGTCREFPLFDIEAGEPLMTLERPLIVMDASIVDYMGLGHGDEALKRILQLKEVCATVRGDFTLLWHNSYFDFDIDRHTYRRCIEAVTIS